MTLARLLGNVGELFTQRRAAAMSRRAGEERRAKLAKALAVADQRAEAGQTLWELGQPAEGIRLTVAALEAALELAAALPSEAPAEEAAAEPDPERPGWLRALDASGRAPHDLDSLAPAVRAVETAALPVRDEQVSAEHRDLYRSARHATDVILARARPFTATAGEIRGRRVARIGGAAAGFLLLALAIVLALR